MLFVNVLSLPFVWSPSGNDNDIYFIKLCLLLEREENFGDKEAGFGCSEK